MTTTDRMMKYYEEAGGRNVGAFPWAIIIDLIISKLLPLICPTAKRVKAYTRRHPEAVEELVGEALLSDGRFPAARDRKAARIAGRQTILSMPNAELQSYIDSSKE